jgi:hypothetical protein
MWFIFNLQRKNKQLVIAKVVKMKTYIYSIQTDDKIEHSAYLYVKNNLYRPCGTNEHRYKYFAFLVVSLG